MKIEIDGILPAVGSMPITEWEIYVDGEKQIIRSFESRGFREFAVEVEPLVVIKKSLEEEKKMLNVDKYREDILEEIKTRETENDNENSSGLVYFDSIGAVKRKYGGGESLYFSDDVKWLFTEYEPPLLENGDGLKPGDWIMVRDCDGERWSKRQFLFYYNGRFYCELVDNSIGGGEYVSWEQARLPEDGE